MTSQSDFDDYVQSQRGVRALLRRDLAKWWASVDGLSPSRQQDEARKYLLVLAAAYGEVSSAAAADFYDLVRESSDAPKGRYAAILAPSVAVATVRPKVGWAVSPLFVDDRAGALGRMAVVTDGAALQEGRNTIMHSAKRDPARPRFARVPVGKTCAWCLMLASRGAVYRSAESAGAAGQYHGGACDCQPVPSFTKGDLPPSYDQEALHGIYKRASGTSPKDIAASIRRLDGGVLVSDGVAPIP